jgi:hypothetical protein
MAQCTATTSNGYRCINKAQDCREVCASHDYRRQCGAPTKSGGRCKRMKVRGHDVCSYHN